MRPFLSVMEQKGTLLVYIIITQLCKYSFCLSIKQIIIKQKLVSQVFFYIKHCRLQRENVNITFVAQMADRTHCANEQCGAESTGTNKTCTYKHARARR